MNHKVPALLALLAGNAFSSVILLSPTPVDLNGTGLGNVNTVLTLQSPGSSSMSSGCVAPGGGGAATVVPTCGPTSGLITGAGTVMTGTSQIGTPTVASLGITSASDLRLIFNAAEPGNDASVTINQLALTFYGPGGTTNVHTLASPITLNSTLLGTGNAGFVFGLDSAQAAAADAFIGGNAAGVRIGLGAALSNATGGHETFFVARANQVPPGGGPGDVVIPEPASFVLTGAGLVAAALIRRKRLSS